MKLSDVIKTVSGSLACGGKDLDLEVKLGFASDLMSDVLTLREDDILLITGLSNVQAVRTAELSDINVILLVRNKQVNPAMLQMAQEAGITIVTTKFSMFKSCGLLVEAGLSPIY